MKADSVQACLNHGKSSFPMFLFHTQLSNVQNPCWLMISWGLYYPLYTGDYDNPRTRNPELHQPGFNGMIFRDFEHGSLGFVLKCRENLGKLDIFSPMFHHRLSHINMLLNWRNTIPPQVEPGKNHPFSSRFIPSVCTME